MSWIGLRNALGGTFAAGGLETTRIRPVDVTGDLPRGTLMLTYDVMPSLGSQDILHYVTTRPRAFAMTLTLHPDGLLVMRHLVNGERRVLTLATGLVGRAAAMTISYSWDTGADRAVLSAYLPETGAHLWASGAAPSPINEADGARMMAQGGPFWVSPKIGFCALARGVRPIGPIPTLHGMARLDTPNGPCAISKVLVGHRVNLVDGGTAQVRWVGATTLPASGPFAPCRLRAPFFGASDDLTAASDQYLEFGGTAVDYVFDTRSVTTRMGDLSHGVTPVANNGKQFARYWQVMLDRPGTLSIAGLSVSPLNVAPLLADAGLRKLSVLSRFPAELLPREVTTTAPLLRPYETRTLCKVRAA